MLFVRHICLTMEGSNMSTIERDIDGNDELEQYVTVILEQYKDKIKQVKEERKVKDK